MTIRNNVHLLCYGIFDTLVAMAQAGYGCSTGCVEDSSCLLVLAIVYEPVSKISGVPCVGDVLEVSCLPLQVPEEDK